MANMLYNGVELPALPDLGTKYAYIVKFIENGDYQLISADNAKAYTNAVTFSNAFGYEQADDEWKYIGSYGYGFNLNYSVGTIIWALEDVYKDTGELYIAGSDPVDPNAPAEPTFDKTAFLSGLAMGLTGKGDPTSGMVVSGGGGASGNMLYNGVELPNIDSVWTNKATHPYAYMDVQDGAELGVTGTFYGLTISANQGTANNGYVTLPYGKFIQVFLADTQELADVLSSVFGITVVANEWISLGEYERENTDAGGAFWSSYDILNTDGTIYLAASNPVPAGGTDAFLKGYLTGAELRAKRVIPESSGANGDGYALFGSYVFPYDLSSVGGGVLTSSDWYELYLFATPAVNSNDPIYYLVVDEGDYAFTHSSSVATELINLGFSNAVVNQWFTAPSPSMMEGYGSLALLSSSDENEDLDQPAYPILVLDGYTLIEWDGVLDGSEINHDGLIYYYRLADYVQPNEVVVVGIVNGYRDRVYADIGSSSWTAFIENNSTGTVDGGAGALASADGFSSNMGPGVWGVKYSVTPNDYTPLIAYKPT